MSRYLTGDETEAELSDLYEQTSYAARLCDIMNLGGCGALAGDIMTAMKILGLKLTGPGTLTVQAAAEAAIETRTCPKCGEEQHRLRADLDYSRGWWHDSEYGGAQRSCPS